MRKRIISTFLCVVLAGSLLAGCGSSSDSDTEAQEAGSEETGDEASTIVIAKSEDPETLDPVLQVSSTGIQILSTVGEGLVKAAEDGQGVEPCLASDWTVSDDGLVYTFTLLPDLKFSDGNDVTLEDWQFTFDRCATTEGSLWNYVAQDVAELTEPEEGTLQFTLNEPSASFLAKLAMFPLYVQEKANYDEIGDEGYATGGAIMCGPFAVQEYAQGEYVTVAENAYYHEESGTAAGGIKFQIATDDDSRVTMLQAGEVDVAENIPPANYDTVDQTEGISATTLNSTETKYFILNTTDEVLQDRDVRKAISLAINKEDMVTMILGGYGNAAVSYMSKYGQYYNEALEEEDDGYDVEEAKALLAQAGYADGFDLEVLIRAGSENESAIVTILKEDLAEIGINVTESAMDDSAYRDAKYNMNYQTCIATWIDDMIDPDGLNGYWWDYSINSAYYSGYESEETTDLYNATKGETDEEKRAEEFDELQQIFYDEVVSIPLYNSPFFDGVSDEVSGYRLTPLGIYYDIAELSK